MDVALEVGCAVLGLSTLTFWLHRMVVGPVTLPLVALAVYGGASALSFIVLLPVVYTWIGARSHVSNLAGAISGCCVLILLGAQQVLLMHWTHPPRLARTTTRLRLLLIGVALAGYLGTFAAQIPRQSQFAYFYLLHSRHPRQAPYLVIYIVACTIGEADVLRYCLRYARVAHRWWLRVGMLVTVNGAVCILLYCVIRVVDLLPGFAVVSLRRWEPVAWLAGDLGSALSLVGWLLPAVGPKLSTAVAWLRGKRQMDLLYPLWTDLLRDVPQVALEPPAPRWRDRLQVRDLEFLLYRRVIEIEDCLRALDLYEARPACGTRDTSTAAGALPEHELDGVTGPSTETGPHDYAANLDRLVSLARAIGRR